MLASEWSWRLLICLAAFALVFTAMVTLSELTIAVSVAVLLAALLYPMADALRRAHIPRGLAALLTLLFLLAFVGGLGTLVGTRIANDIDELSASVSNAIGQLQGVLSTFGIAQQDLQGAYDRVRTTLTSGGAGGVVSGALSVGTQIGHVVTGAVVALFTLFFFLSDGRNIWAFLAGRFPAETGEVVDAAGRRAFAAITGFVRATVIVALVDAVGVGVVAAVLGVKLAVPLGILVFIGAFIPIVGTLASGTVAVLVAFVGSGPLVALFMLLGVLVVVELEGHVMQPLLLGRAVSLHPLAVFLAITAGGLLGGIVGVLFAVPVAAAATAILRQPRPTSTEGPGGERRTVSTRRDRFRLFSRRRRRAEPAATPAGELGAGELEAGELGAGSAGTLGGP